MSLFTFIIKDSEFNRKELNKIHNVLCNINLRLLKIENQLDTLETECSIKKELEEITEKVIKIKNQVTNILP